GAGGTNADPAPRDAQPSVDAARGHFPVCALPRMAGSVCTPRYGVTADVAEPCPTAAYTRGRRDLCPLAGVLPGCHLVASGRRGVSYRLATARLSGAGRGPGHTTHAACRAASSGGTARPSVPLRGGGGHL